MRITLWATFLLTLTCNAWGWGQTGHRVIAGIAEQRLNIQGKQLVKELLDDNTLPEVSNYMDFIRSNRSFKYLEPYHYVNIPEGETYTEIKKNPDGDILTAICNYYDKLISIKKPKPEKQQALKFLVHLMGDIHQPLHAGRKDDFGGFLVKVKWFDKKGDLHKVWDEELIDSQKLSYTEYVSFIYKQNPDTTDWEKYKLLDCIKEDQDITAKIYEQLDSFKIKTGYSLTYRYIYDNIDLVNKRLLQAGVRLAVLINLAAAGAENTECKELKN